MTLNQILTALNGCTPAELKKIQTATICLLDAQNVPISRTADYIKRTIVEYCSKQALGFPPEKILKARKLDKALNAGGEVFDQFITTIWGSIPRCDLPVVYHNLTALLISTVILCLKVVGIALYKLG